MYADHHRATSATDLATVGVSNGDCRRTGNVSRAVGPGTPRVGAQVTRRAQVTPPSDNIHDVASWNTYASAVIGAAAIGAKPIDSEGLPAGAVVRTDAEKPSRAALPEGDACAGAV
jgi:hypothetical protein